MRGLVHGWRAVVQFAPKPASPERVVAGVVLRTDDGAVHWLCALDEAKSEDAFGMAGRALHTVAQHLCSSLAQYWQAEPDLAQWKPPFANAGVVELVRFSARTPAEDMQMFLARTSTFHTLFGKYEMDQQARTPSIVQQVLKAVKRDPNAKHLAGRFGKNLMVHGEAAPLKVDFLGQRYACYFLQITRSAQGVAANTERAYGKLFELQALRRLVRQPPKGLGLLDEERPEVFELLMVGSRTDAVQRSMMRQVETLAEKSEVVARIEPSAAAAAERVSTQERLAA